MKEPCIIQVEKGLYRLVPTDFNGQDCDMDVNFVTDCICEFVVPGGVDMFP